MLATNFSHPIAISEEEADWHFKPTKVVIVLERVKSKEKVVETDEEGIICACWPQKDEFHVFFVIS